MTNTLAVEYDPFATAVQSDPYPYYADLREHSPVHYVDALNAFVVSRHADVRRVMRDHHAFSSEAMAALVSRPVQYAADADLVEDADDYPLSLIGLDGDEHSRLRHIVNRGFTPRRIGALEAEMRVVAGEFADRLVAEGTADLQTGLAVPFPTVVIATMLGVEPDERDAFRQWSEMMVRAVFEPTTITEQRDIARAGEEMGAWLDRVIAEREDSDGDDLISVLLRAEQEDGALTHDESRVFVSTLLVAGSITTAYLIGNAATSLLADPDLLVRVRESPNLMSAVVEESLRHDAPVQMMFRTATGDIEIAGNAIPAGATVVALLGSANRDARVFVDPDRFDATRGATEHVSFGYGVHFCLGAALARLEARVALQELVARASRLETVSAIERVSSLVFRGPARLPLRYR